MKKNIVWLASYPKSGNTWFRTFLSTILQEQIGEPDINDLNSTPIASAREIFEEIAGTEASDLTHDEIDLLRPDVYRKLSEIRDDVLYMKIHDAFTKNTAGEWIFPVEAVQGVIYIVRNPLDVAVSFANHSSRNIDNMVHNLCDSKFALCRGTHGLSNQLRQIHLSWSEHAQSWLESPNRLCLLRYEDMLNDSFHTFKRAVDFLGLDKSDDEILEAIERCSFANLRKQEEDHSFGEKPQKCEFFFRKGVVGDWREHLSGDHVRTLVSCHYDMMKRLGYVDEHDELTV